MTTDNAIIFTSDNSSIVLDVKVINALKTLVTFSKNKDKNLQPNIMNHSYTFLFLCLLASFSSVNAQDSTGRNIGYSGLPVVASSPETGFKYGVFGQVSFDLVKNNGDSRQSQQKLGITYSTRKQFSAELEGFLFGRDENFFIRNRIEYVNWVDRHYGLGNDASNQFIEYQNGSTVPDTFNFLNYKLDVLMVEFSYSKKIRKGLFAGIGLDVYHANDFQELADSSFYTTDEIIANDMVGQYYGLGWNFIYDKRDNINNPYQGAYVLVSNFYYLKWLGADYRFSTFQLDARKYFNVYNNQILALRGMFSNTFSNDVIPYTGYQRLGGSRTLRGYYNGTYLDKHMMLFDVEYRIPFFQDVDAPTWKIWRHLGLTAFASTGKVYNEFSDFNFSDMHYSVGGGMRIMISKRQRTNIRLDYGVGFTDDADGIGKRQSGFYISVNEAF